MTKIGNHLKLIGFAAALGGVTGTIIWAFLKAVSFGTGLLWERLPETFSFSGYAIIVCAIGGLLIGLFRKKFGDYPEELSTVMGKVKKEGHYNYSNMLVMLVAAFLPLVFASSVGPEAGLTGVIVGLCYWVGDNLKYAREHEKEYSEIGEAVTLGVLFHVPLFGIFAVEEENAADGDGAMLPKPMKLLLYGGAIAGGVIAFDVFTHLFGAAMGGFPAFENVSLSVADYMAMIFYVICGVAMAYLFEWCEHAAGGLAKRLPAVLCETVCGLVLGIVITFFPAVAFSGEEQMGALTDAYASYTALALIGIGILKVLMTTFCIQMEMKGGHFFPLIFACVCVGFGVGILFFGYDILHLVFAAGTVTAACLGTQMKKPLAVTILCLLCFPTKMIFFLFLAAAIGGGIASREKETT